MLDKKHIFLSLFRCFRTGYMLDKKHMFLSLFRCFRTGYIHMFLSLFRCCRTSCMLDEKHMFLTTFLSSFTDSVICLLQFQVDTAVFVFQFYFCPGVCVVWLSAVMLQVLGGDMGVPGGLLSPGSPERSQSLSDLRSHLLHGRPPHARSPRGQHRCCHLCWLLASCCLTG